jgi:cell division protease FtsH
MWDKLRWYVVSLLLSPLRIVRLVMNVAILYLFLKLVPASGVVDMETVVVQVPYSDFMRKVERDQVQDLEIDGVYHKYSLRNKASSAEFRRLASSLGRQKQKFVSLDKIKQINYVTIRPANMPTPYDTLLKNNVQFGAPDKRFNRVMTFMTHAFAIGLALALISRFSGRMGGGSGGMRKPRKLASRQNIKFDDVAGVDEAKEELEEVVAYLKNPEKFTRLGARPPAGLLLVGSPGTGKTLLAKAVAGEANVPFFSIAASEFVELYVGMGASRVRELFAKARKESPAIVFIDEIDAVAKGRDSRLRSVGNDEREQTLNQLLTELDGFDTNKDSVVICMAATNRPDVLDQALLRPGRFDRRITVERPDRVGREQILKVHVMRQSLPLSDDINLESVATETIGFTGADLANIVNEAALLAGRRGKEKVEHSDFQEAIERNIAGIEKKRSFLKGREKYIVAVHEAGHAILGTAVSNLIPNLASEVEKLSIVPRSSGALGFTYIPPNDDRALMFETELRGRLAMLMGGRAAEDVEGNGVVTTGASDDINRATEIAYKIVAEWGLSPNIGPISVATLATGADGNGYAWREQGGALAEQVDKEVKTLLDGALHVAKDALMENNKVFNDLAVSLEEQEKLQGPTLAKKLTNVRIPKKLKLFIEKGEVSY